MNSIIVVLVIFLLIIFYLSPFVIKKSFKKPSKKAAVEKPVTENLTNYYKPLPVWSADTSSQYLAFSGSATESGGVSVVGSGECGLYTYATPLISENSTKSSNGSFNPLSQVVYTKPNIENAFQDYVDGKSHLTGKIKDQVVTCVDQDQVYVKRVEKKCEVNNTQNKCLTSQGFRIKNGETFSYNKPCLQNPCPGIVGSLSLNYLTDGTVVLPSTMCISISGISIPPSVLADYNLEFFQELQNINGGPIINLDSSVPSTGPFPISFEFDSCNPEDARQRLKFVNYTYSPKTQSFVQSKTGSFGSIIFRGLDSYLDIVNGNNFVLRKLTDKLEDSIKWVFMPELNLTKNTIPSSQRCSILTTLMTNGEGEEEIAAAHAKFKETAHGLGLSKLAFTGINNTLIAKLAQRQLALDARKNPAFSTQGEDAGDDFDNITGADLTGGDPGGVTSDVDPTGSLGPTPTTGLQEGGEGLDVTAADAGDLAGDATAAGAAEIVAAGTGQIIIGGLATVLSYIAPIGLVLSLLSALAQVIPNPSYSTPPFGSLTTSTNQLVSPTDYGSNVTGTGPTGVPTLENFNNVCVPWMHQYYPPYYLEAVEAGSDISIEFINYQYSTGTAVSYDEVATFGGVSSNGLFIWNSPNNIKDISINQIWKDGNTQWLVHNIFDNSLAFPPGYFSQSNLNGALEVSPVILKSSSAYQNSRVGVISSSSGLCFSSQDLELFKRNGRLANSYLNVSGSTSGQGTSALFNVTVQNSQTTGSPSTTVVKTVEVSYGGQNYKEGDTITIQGTSIGGSSSFDNINFYVNSVEDEIFIFRALDKTNENYFYPGEASEKVVQGGFETFGVVKNDSANVPQIFLSKDSNQKVLVANSGFNYEVGSPIYLAQYNYLNQRVSNPSQGPSFSSPESLFESLTVNSLTSSGYGYGEISPEVLVSENNVIINYNFMDSATNLYSASPQQIVYAGVSVSIPGSSPGSSPVNTSLARVLGEATGGNINPRTLYEYFKLESDNQFINTSKDSPIINLKSIQIQNLKYIETVDGTVAGSTFTGASSSVSTGDSIVLGRFIPYQYFAPATKREKNTTFNVVTNSFDTGTDTDVNGLYYGSSVIYYNGNYSQIIPYGTRNVYENASFPQCAPKF